MAGIIITHLDVLAVLCGVFVAGAIVLAIITIWQNKE